LTTTNDRADETLRVARARYWEANGFGDDGGESKTWEIVKIGPIPIPIRNIEARKSAIRYHDLHHVVTGYDTSFAGEAEISAWELRTGCADQWVAWLLGFQILLFGLWSPRRMLRAWTRGGHTQSLYTEDFNDALLDSTVGEVRQRLGLDQAIASPTLFDRMSLIFWTLASVVGQAGALGAAVYALIWLVS